MKNLFPREVLKNGVNKWNFKKFLIAQFFWLTRVPGSWWFKVVPSWNWDRRDTSSRCYWCKPAGITPLYNIRILVSHLFCLERFPKTPNVTTFSMPMDMFFISALQIHALCCPFFVILSAILWSFMYLLKLTIFI